jgi:imidazole glycerol-phosphate synthase subunit HisF
MGVEKAIMNSAAMADMALVSKAADAVGSQSVVVSIDVKKNIFGKYCARALSGSQAVDAGSLPQLVQRLVAAGAGEILLNNIDRDGTQAGYDHALVRQVTSATDVPVISCGGASGVVDLARAVVQSGAAACAAGALFTYRGPHRAVLLNYPNPAEVNTAVNELSRS